MRKAKVHTRRKTGRPSHSIKPALLTLAIAQALAFQTVQAASIEVTSNLDDGTDCTIREAIETVNAGVDLANGCIINGALGTTDAISFGAGVAGSTIVTNGELTITQSVSINSGGAPTTIDANGVGRVFCVGSRCAPPFSRTDGTVELDQLTLTGGNSPSGGGGISAYDSPVTLSNSTVSGNGGGIDALFSPITLTNSTVSGNGFGISAVHSYVTLTNSTVSGNGFGIDAYNFSDVTLTNSTVSGNGSGIGATDSPVTLTNSTVSGNSGPGIDARYLDVTLTNSTVSGNGSGIYARGFSDVTLNNSIVANSLGADCSTSLSNYPSTVTAMADSIIEDGSCGTTAMAVDPLLGPLADNGGPTQTHALLDGSPAINKGDPNFTPPPEFDQRGPGFPRVVGGRIDIGAFESELVPASAKLASLGDINGDGNEDVAVLIHDTAAGTVTATVKDAENDQLIKAISFNPDRTPVAFEVMDDIDGNGAPELVVLGEGSVEVEIRDSLSGVLQNTVSFNPNRSPIDLAILPDQNGNGIPELAVLDRSSFVDAVSVVVKDAMTKESLNYVGFNPNYTPLELAVLADLNSNGTVELAVLGVDGNAAGNDKVDIRDSGTGALINNVFYSPSIQAKRLAVLADQNSNMAEELVVLRQGRWVEARINDALNDTFLNRIGHNPHFLLSQVFTIRDLNGNGVPEIGVLGTNAADDDLIRVQIRDALTDMLISSVYFGRQFQPQDDVAVVNDINGNGSPELVYLGKRESDGKLRVIITDSLTAAVINTVDF